MDCPPATQDVAINTKNRNATIKNFGYGPLNVDEPGDFWEKIAKQWETSVDAAKKSKCGNCVAFDRSPRMKDCMPGETSDGEGVLGYCWMHHFKCHFKELVILGLKEVQLQQIRFQKVGKKEHLQKKRQKQTILEILKTIQIFGLLREK